RARPPQWRHLRWILVLRTRSRRLPFRRPPRVLPRRAIHRLHPLLRKHLTSPPRSHAARTHLEPSAKPHGRPRLVAKPRPAWRKTRATSMAARTKKNTFLRAIP